MAYGTLGKRPACQYLPHQQSPVWVFQSSCAAALEFYFLPVRTRSSGTRWGLRRCEWASRIAQEEYNDQNDDGCSFVDLAVGGFNRHQLGTDDPEHYGSSGPDHR